MKVLLDACVWGGVRGELAATGHDVVWAGEWSEDPGDEEILIRAHNEGRILFTMDKDFGEVAIVHGLASFGHCWSCQSRCATTGEGLRPSARKIRQGALVRSHDYCRTGSCKNSAAGCAVSVLSKLLEVTA